MTTSVEPAADARAYTIAGDPYVHLVARGHNEQLLGVVVHTQRGAWETTYGGRHHIYTETEADARLWLDIAASHQTGVLPPEPDSTTPGVEGFQIHGVHTDPIVAVHIGGAP